MKPDWFAMARQRVFYNLGVWDDSVAALREARELFHLAAQRLDDQLPQAA